MISKKEDGFYRALGLRLMMQRQSRRISLGELGESIGVTAYQVHKYENGINRISPERLYLCAQALNVPVNYFFGENEEGSLKHYDKSILLTASEIDALPEEVKRAVLHMVRAIERALRNPSNDNGAD